MKGEKSMKITKRKVIQLTKVEHNRGFIEEQETNGVKQEWIRLVIDAERPYDYLNWSRADLADLANAINEFLALI